MNLKKIIKNPDVQAYAYSLGMAGLTWAYRTYSPKVIDHVWKSLKKTEKSICVEVPASDEAFYWINSFLASRPEAKKSTNLRLSTARNYDDCDYPGDYEMDRSNWHFAPGVGSTTIVDPNYTVTITREEKESDKGGIVESFIIACKGESQEPVRKFLNACQTRIKTVNKLNVYSFNEGYWNGAKTGDPRPLDTIILQEGQMERIVDDIKWFLSNREFYKKRGIPYHRGYLLSGPPGTGKTSMVTALAGYFKMNVGVLNIGNCPNDASLSKAFSNLPNNSMMAIEDIDAATDASDSREGENKKEKRGVTLAGLLNQLDGAATADGSIVFLTTNYPERLDAALIRPGRVDLQETLGNMHKAEQERMSLKFYDEAISVDREVSPATMQGILIRHLEDREGALAALQALPTGHQYTPPEKVTVRMEYEAFGDDDDDVPPRALR